MTKAELIDKVAQAISKSADVSKKATGEIIDLAVAEVAKAIRKEPRVRDIQRTDPQGAQWPQSSNRSRHQYQGQQDRFVQARAGAQEETLAAA